MASPETTGNSCTDEMQSYGQYWWSNAPKNRSMSTDVNTHIQLPPISLGLGPSDHDPTLPRLPQLDVRQSDDSRPAKIAQKRQKDSVVGLPGYPGQSPVAEPKQRFSQEDDQKLICLKEEKGLRWSQITEFFPGRNSGTLQVRYCTRLSTKAISWNYDLDNKLRDAEAEVESAKWDRVAQNMGLLFTADQCKQRYLCLQNQERRKNDDEADGRQQHREVLLIGDSEPRFVDP